MSINTMIDEILRFRQEHTLDVKNARVSVREMKGNKWLISIADEDNGKAYDIKLRPVSGLMEADMEIESL